jgi:hypothetical protein
VHFHGSVLATIQGIMLKLQGYSVYKRCELVCNGPIIKDTLHGKQSNFSAGSRFQFEVFS